MFHWSVLVSDFDFPLPEELIAKEPLADRASSRMLHLMRAEQRFVDGRFLDFPDLLHPKDLLIFNNTRVFPARLFGRRSGLHAQKLSQNNPAMKEFLTGRVEVLLNRQTGEHTWEALVRPGRKIGVGERIHFPDERTGQDVLHAEIVARGEFGERTLLFDPVPDFHAAVEQIGHVPLPPYIDRSDRSEDRERYQTVYAQDRGSVAAPTAGLHFTPAILDRIRERGIETAAVTLHVGLGTFQPLRSEVVEENRLHREHFRVSEQTAEQVNRALQDGRRIVAIGTTSVRTLEFCAQRAAAEGKSGIVAGSGEADIFIYPGFEWKVVGAMLTNFHLPKSSLIMLVSAFAGREFTLQAYEHAVRERYRFFSYGDCMFVE